LKRGTYLGAIVRHALGLYRGVAGARLAARAVGQQEAARGDLSVFDEARTHLNDAIENFEKMLCKMEKCSYNLVLRC
jgi:tRNA-dihydrouridine synthase A